MTSIDEELREPARKSLLTLMIGLLVGAAALAGIVVASTSDDKRPGAKPPASRSMSPSPSPTTSSPSFFAREVALGPPPALVRAVHEFYPHAKLAEMGTEVTASASPARNYQFMAGKRRVTVVVGRIDTRPDVVSRTENAIVVVRTVLGRRLAISVRVFAGRLGERDARVARRLAGDVRLLTPP